jgi:hypothetical protein
LHVGGGDDSEPERKKKGTYERALKSVTLGEELVGWNLEGVVKAYFKRGAFVEPQIVIRQKTR